MSVECIEHDRTIRDNLVEQRFVGVSLFKRQWPSAPFDPFSIRIKIGIPLHGGEDLINTGQSINIAFTQFDAAPDQMDVRIMKAR